MHNSHGIIVTPMDKKNFFLQFTLPKDEELGNVVENITVWPEQLPIYLRGAGPDKISVSNLIIYQYNAICSPLVLVVLLPASQEEMPNSIKISYDLRTESPEKQKTNKEIAARSSAPRR